MRRAIWQADMRHSSSDRSAPEHLPVMREEVLELLQCKPGGIFVDATLGLGGHARAVLEKIRPGGLLIGLDRDQESLEKAALLLQPYSDSTRLLHENYKNLPLVLNNLGIKSIDGILVDLGVLPTNSCCRSAGSAFRAMPCWTCAWTGLSG